MDESYKELISKANGLSAPKQLSEEATAGYCGAVMQMLQDGESHIEVVVAVSNDSKLMPPCGRCREMIYQINRANLDTKFLLEENRVTTLAELLPERWEDLWAQPAA